MKPGYRKTGEGMGQSGAGLRAAAVVECRLGAEKLGGLPEGGGVGKSAEGG